MEAKIKELENKIVEAADAYYNSGNPIMSDEEFDNLIEKLRQDDPSNKLLTTTGWGVTIKDTHKEKFPHTFLVVGLDKVQSVVLDPSSLSYPLVMSSKLDGLTGVAYYNEGNLLKYVLTRNDGEVGLDITNSLKYCNIPKTVPSEIKWVRGEIVTTFEAAKKYNYVHPRNMASGLANSDELSEASQELEFVAFNCNDISLHDDHQYDLRDKLGLLANIGFKIVNHWIYWSPDDFPFYDHHFNYTREDYIGYEYPVDGAVVYEEKTGRNFAIKYPNRLVQVEVVGIVNQVSSRGRVTPVIEIKPIELDGCTITYCSGFNYEKIMSRQVREGSLIYISRANGVIPDWNYDKLVDNSYCENSFELPMEVEVEGKSYITRMVGCQLEIIIDKSLDCVRDLMAVKCPHGVAGAKVNALIERFKLTSPIKLSKFVSDLFNNDPFSESDYYQKEILKLIGETYYHRAIELLKGVHEGYTMSDLLVSTFSRNLGKVAADKLMEIYQNDPFKMINDLELDGGLPKAVDLMMPTYVVAEGVKENFALIVEVLMSMNVKSPEPKIDTSNAIKICLTGKLSKPRGDLVAEWGNKVVEVDIGKCDYLITDDPSSGSSKNEKAKKLGKHVVSEKDFRKIIGE